jgi:hypothetical protein
MMKYFESPNPSISDPRREIPTKFPALNIDKELGEVTGLLFGSSPENENSIPYA